MSEEKEHQKGKIIVTVLLSTGKEVRHAYDAGEEIEEVMSMVFTALGSHQTHYLSFNNPDIVYNPDNVLSVQFDYLSSMQIEKFRKQMKERMGYIKDVK